jgi:hypothetical protein
MKRVSTNKGGYEELMHIKLGKRQPRQPQSHRKTPQREIDVIVDLQKSLRNFLTGFNRFH